MRLNLSPAVERYQLIAGADEGDPGVAIMARPALTSIIEDAKADDCLIAYADEIRAMVEVGEDAEVSAEVIRSKGRVGLMFAKAVARRVIDGWDGVEDEDGQPAPVTPDRIDAFLDIAPIYDAFTSVYLTRWLIVQHEKNVSAPSPNGTSVGVQTTAQAAKPSAGNARAGRTARKPKKAG
ncbi:hypothetical protein [Seohaeicola zhoushanensis]|uniref:Uncharacterized protein n=1 Tax=Seohaeicola zhoushanensis TaxID=1569283 RepID=A0A8J3M9W9_9RHOB|nr:hypothetical protein [Seohaeicola zhoushanensis]GHF71180.1 hypothetical protein GCM10017056_47620 [Seohaeicola zhoushanensis]